MKHLGLIGYLGFVKTSDLVSVVLKHKQVLNKVIFLLNSMPPRPHQKKSISVPKYSEDTWLVKNGFNIYFGTAYSIRINLSQVSREGQKMTQIHKITQQ